MGLSFYHNHRQSLLLAAELGCQNLAMRCRDHPVEDPMDHLHSLSAHLVAYLGDLSGTFIVPASRNSLQEKARHGESERICLLPDLLSCESVAIRGKVPFGVWFFDPFVAKHTRFYVGELDVHGLGNTERIAMSVQH